jgi:hypothetical protein
VPRTLNVSVPFTAPRPLSLKPPQVVNLRCSWAGWGRSGDLATNVPV